MKKILASACQWHQCRLTTSPDVTANSTRYPMKNAAPAVQEPITRISNPPRHQGWYVTLVLIAPRMNRVVAVNAHEMAKSACVLRELTLDE